MDCYQCLSCVPVWLGFLHDLIILVVHRFFPVKSFKKQQITEPQNLNNREKLLWSFYIEAIECARRYSACDSLIQLIAIDCMKNIYMYDAAERVTLCR